MNVSILLVSCFLFFACSKHQTSGLSAADQPPKRLFTAEDFAHLRTFTVIEKESILENALASINWEIPPYSDTAEKPKEEKKDASDWMGRCMDRQMGQISPIITADRIIFSGHVNASREGCKEEYEAAKEEENEDAVITKFSLKMDLYTEIKCDGANFTKLDGKTFKDDQWLAKAIDDHCAKSPVYSMLQNVRTITETRIQFFGYTVDTVVEAKNGTGTSDGEPCVFTRVGEAWNSGPCMHISSHYPKSIKDRGVRPEGFSLESMEYIYFAHVNTDDAKARLKDRYYFEQPLPVVVNNWKGAVKIDKDGFVNWKLKTPEGLVEEGRFLADPKDPEDDGG